MHQNDKENQQFKEGDEAEDSEQEFLTETELMQETKEKIYMSNVSEVFLDFLKMILVFLELFKRYWINKLREGWPKNRGNQTVLRKEF